MIEKYKIGDFWLANTGDVFKIDSKIETSFVGKHIDGRSHKTFDTKGEWIFSTFGRIDIYLIRQLTPDQDPEHFI